MAKVKKRNPNSLVLLVIASLIVGVGLGYYFGYDHGYEKVGPASNSEKSLESSRAGERLIFTPPTNWIVSSQHGVDTITIDSPDFGQSESGIPHDANGASISVQKTPANHKLGANQEIEVKTLEDYLKHSVAGRNVEKAEIDGNPAYAYLTDNVGSQKNYVVLSDSQFWNFSMYTSDEETLNRYLPEFEDFISSIRLKKASSNSQW